MVELVRSGRTPEELSREFEPTAQSITNWVKQAERDTGRRTDGPTSAEREELIRLRRENQRLRQERDMRDFCSLVSLVRTGSIRPSYSFFSSLASPSSTYPKTPLKGSTPWPGTSISPRP